MSHNRTNLEEFIVSAKPAELSATEETVLFEAVQARVTRTSVPSPFIFLTHYRMIPILLILALTLGAGGTVAASDSARPGDALYSIDRALEGVRLSFASDDKKNELRIKYADERLREFNAIAGDDSLSGTLTEAEADIFTNETVVKLEAGDRKVVFITSADTREEIIDAIQDRYGFSESDIDAVLRIETEDRASRTDDKDGEGERSERLEHALDVLGDFIEDNRNAASTSPGVLTALALIEARLLEREAYFPEEVRVKIEEDRARYEVRGEDGERVRVEIKDGEVRIKSNDDDDDDRDDDSSRHGSDDDDSEDRDGVSTSQGFLEVEADVFTDITTVKVELNDRTTTFTTNADTRQEVIDEVQDRFDGLTEAEIDAALDFEIEDRASRTDDLDDDSSGRDDDDEDEDDDDNDDDEDDDDDHSGRGRGGDDKDDDD